MPASLCCGLKVRISVQSHSLKQGRASSEGLFGVRF
jgi:hypothetical protein